MIRYLAAMAVGVFAFLNAPILSAHHGWSGYDSATVLNLTGPIARVSYVNPTSKSTSTPTARPGPRFWHRFFACRRVGFRKKALRSVTA